MATTQACANRRELSLAFEV